MTSSLRPLHARALAAVLPWLATALVATGVAAIFIPPPVAADAFPVLDVAIDRVVPPAESSHTIEIGYVDNGLHAVRLDLDTGVLWRDDKIARVVSKPQAARFRLYAAEGCSTVPARCCDCYACCDVECSSSYNDQLVTMVIDFGSCHLETSHASQDWLLEKLHRGLRDLADQPSLPDDDLDGLLLPAPLHRPLTGAESSR